MEADRQLLDCLIIGGGAAGLTAAIYLARFRRRIRVIDAGSSRLLSIPASHNYPGFAEGIPGIEIRERLRAQANHYGAALTDGVVERIERLPGGVFLATLNDGRWQARYLILAAGVLDVEPDFPDTRRALAQGCLRYCPICDGFESIGKKVAVVGRGSAGWREALFIRHFTTDISLLSLTEPIGLEAAQREALDQAAVRVVPEPVARLAFDDAGVMQLHFRGGARERFDVVYGALGTLVNSGLAQALGAACTGDGELIVDAHQQTTVDGLYAAGDVVAGLNQITVAMGHAAIAATAIHNRLR